MPYYEKISCRVAIQVCIGHFPDGRERHRTFSIRGVNPDAPLEPIEAVVRALAPILAYPITKVRKVIKRKIFFYEEAALPVPFNSEYETEASLCVIRNMKQKLRFAELKSQGLILPLLLIPHSAFRITNFFLPSPFRSFLMGRSPPFQMQIINEN